MTAMMVIMSIEIIIFMTNTTLPCTMETSAGTTGTMMSNSKPPRLHLHQIISDWKS
jgi:hypothetical protein